jgi:UDP-glucuronate 4-epimerase
MNKTVLLTGAAGFIGYHVAEVLLARGDIVIGIDSLNDYYSPKLKRDRLARLTHENFHFHENDISDEKTIQKIFATQPIDAICHLAAQAGVRYSLQNPMAYVQSNLVGSVVLLEATRHAKIPHFVYASSSSVYGGSGNSPFSEGQLTDNPVSLYAATKKSLEVIAHSYHHLFGFTTTGLRFFTVYGPWGRPDMAAYLFAKAILEDRPIDVYNHGKMQRDFTYIDDIVRGVIASIDMPQGNQIFNLGGSNVTELETYISTLEEKLGKKAIKNYLPMQPGDVPLTSADTSKAKRLLGWEATVSLDEGLQRFCSWLTEYSD